MQRVTNFLAPGVFVNKLMHQLPVLIALFCLIVAGALGCGGADVKEDESPAESPVVYEDAPEPDRLADAPCGEPDWSEPPPEVISLEEDED